VDIGGGTTDVAIFYEGIIRHTAVIPFGGNVITEDIKEGCTIMKRQAEMLKVKFGSALASESLENEVVCIPGIRGKAPREITVRNLASIIQARMEEIIELVHYEVLNSGYSKKLIGGIVVTGGGAQMKHITQLFEYITGMDTRIGYPTEHLANNNHIENLTSPMYSTGIGLVLKGFESLEKNGQTLEVASTGKVKTHSGTNRGSIFETIIKAGKNLFAEED
jgi:cell division protein FtsA